MRRAFPGWIHWRLNADGKPWYPRYSGNLLGWDPRIGRYVFYAHYAAEVLGRATSPDFTTWSDFEEVLKARKGWDSTGWRHFLRRSLLGWLWTKFKDGRNERSWP